MMKRKSIIVFLILISTFLLVACGNHKTNENYETLDDGKFTQEMISELEEDVKGGTYEFATLICINEKYGLTAGNYEITDFKQTDEYTCAAYGKIKVKDNNGNIKDKNIVVIYKLNKGEPGIYDVTLK